MSKSNRCQSCASHGSEILTPQQVANEFLTTVQTLANWRSAGIGPPFVKFGAQVRYRRAGLEEWIEQNTRATKTGSRQAA